MTEYRKIDLYKAITDNGSVEITVVPNDEENELVREITFTNYFEALSEIIDLEYGNTVYF